MLAVCFAGRFRIIPNTLSRIKILLGNWKEQTAILRDMNDAHTLTPNLSYLKIILRESVWKPAFTCVEKLEISVFRNIACTVVPFAGRQNIILVMNHYLLTVKED